MSSVAVITVSDRSAGKLREDLSGPEIVKWTEKMGFDIYDIIIVPDERADIVTALKECISNDVRLVFTTGGTGFAPRDVTPEATREVIEREAPGFCEVMRMKSLEVTPHAMLSRAVAGIACSTLIINLPGSPKAVRENLGFIEKAIPHAVSLLENSVTDCGSE